MTTREHFRRVGENPWIGGWRYEQARAMAEQAGDAQTADARANSAAPDGCVGVPGPATWRKDEASCAAPVQCHSRTAAYYVAPAIQHIGSDAALVDWYGNQRPLEWMTWLKTTRPAVSSPGPSQASADKRASHFAAVRFSADALCRKFVADAWLSSSEQLLIVNVELVLALGRTVPARSNIPASVPLTLPGPPGDKPVWWPEIAAAVERDLAELAPIAVEAGRSALDDACRLVAIARIQRPDTWSMSAEGVLSLEWDRGERAGFMIVFSGALEASFAVRTEMFFSLMEDFSVEAGLPQHALQALEELPRA